MRLASIQTLNLPIGLLLLLLLAAQALLALDPSRAIDQFSYQTWQTGSGLPQNTVHSILQTKDGFLWFATEGGLARFDGYQFLVFDSHNTPALKTDNIRALAEDRQGTLWIGTGNGLARRAGDSFEVARLASGKTILALRTDSSDSLLVVTPEGVIRRKPDGTLTTFDESDSAPRLTGATAVSPDGTIWLGTQDGLRKLRNGSLTSTGAGLPHSSVNALLLDQGAKLWAATSQGLWTAEAHEKLTFELAVKGPAKEPVLSLFEDGHGIIWVGTEHGFARLGKGGGRALAGEVVIAMGEDTEGDLWVGTEARGATVLRNQKFVTITRAGGLSDEAVRCVYEGHDGTVSMGTNHGVLQLRNGSLRQLTTHDGLSSNVVLSLGEDREGALLVGTPDGLNRLAESKVSIITSADGLADDFVRSIYKDLDGSLWIGTRRGLAHEEGNRRFRTYTQADGLGSDLVGAMLRDRGGDLWVATLDGLSRMQAGHFRTYRKPDGLSSNIVTALHQDAEGDLWIGTQDAGLNLWHAGRFSSFIAHQGLPHSIFGIGEDLNGEFWIASKVGIARVNKDALRRAALEKGQPANVVWYGTSDGLRINECSVGGHPETWRAKDGTLWFSTMRGAAALDPSSARLRRAPIPVAIEAVTIDDRRYAPMEVKTVAPGHDRFVFEYAGLSFAAAQKVIYRYRLEGFDKDWVNAGTQRTASYTNIPPGQYRFSVLARNSDGFWDTAGASLKFRLEPQFYQTFWFYALVALGLAGAGYLVYHWRVREVEARFDAVLQERNRIGREIHDTLAQGFVGVSVQLETVSRLLATSTDAAREHLDQARLLVRESLSEARRSIWQLRSQAKKNEDLAVRLSKAATQTVGLSPVKLSLEVRGTYRPLGKEVEDELLRIGQEAVTNALRHAHCQHLTVELAYGQKSLLMTVKDDGLGFDPELGDLERNGHFGLRGMKERVQQIGGKLGIESFPGKGTKISVETPLK